MSNEPRLCFYCGSFAPYTVVVGQREYPCCKECKFNEAPKDGFVTRPK
jgi:hypothetical protein